MAIRLVTQVRSYTHVEKLSPPTPVLGLRVRYGQKLQQMALDTRQKRAGKVLIGLKFGIVQEFTSYRFINHMQTIENILHHHSRRDMDRCAREGGGWKLIYSVMSRVLGTTKQELCHCNQCHSYVGRQDDLRNKRENYAW